MKKAILTLSLVSLFAISCEQHIEAPAYEFNSEALAFSASIMPTTRATDISFDQGDQISLYATDKGSLYSNNYAQNVKYTYYDGLFTTQESLTYPDKNTTLAFYAVYPYGNYSTPEFEFIVKEDQSNYDSYTASDLMTASNTGRNEEVVDLTFNHNLTKIIINLSSENLPAGTQTVTLKNVYYKATANLSSNTFKATGRRTDIKASPNGTNSFKAIIPPQTIAKGELFAEITIGSDTYIWEVERDLIHSSGVEYVYNLTLQDSSIKFRADINPWNESSDIQAVIPQEYIDLLSPYIPIYEGDTPPDIQGVWLTTPFEMYYDSEGSDAVFADAWFYFYDQRSDNTISMKLTQNLGDLSLGEGAFISGTGDNFTVYFNEYTTREDGSWMLSASLVSGTLSGSCIKNFKFGFIVIDTYDPYEEMMKPGAYRIIEDADYYTYQSSWPLNTKGNPGSGCSIFQKIAK